MDEPRNHPNVAESGRRLRVLMELRPCYEGYAGIPQQTRALFAALAAAPGIALGGLVNHSLDEAGGPCPRPSLITRLRRAAEARIARRFGRAGERVCRLLRILPRLGHRQRMSRRPVQLDPVRAEAWLWTRLFSRGWPAARRGLITRASYPLATLDWADSAVLHLFGKRARATLDLAPGRERPGWDLLVAQTPWPTSVVGGRLVVGYFDAIPLYWPHTISSAPGHAHSHYTMLAANVAEGAWFVCNTEAVRADLLRAFPDARTRVVPVLTAQVPQAQDETPPDPARLAQILARGRAAGARLRGDPPPLPTGPHAAGADEPYFLAVSTLEPRKNFGLLMRAAARARRGGLRARLVMVARPGWRSDDELLTLRALVAEGVVEHLADLSGDDLSALYRGARAVVCPSRSEGFDLATTEAMAAGVPVLCSDIDVHREVCGPAAAYFDPYDLPELTALLARFGGMAEDDPQLAAMRAASRARARHFAPGPVAEAWIAALQAIHAA